jgi:hypothetical protein
MTLTPVSLMFVTQSQEWRKTDTSFITLSEKQSQMQTKLSVLNERLETMKGCLEEEKSKRCTLVIKEQLKKENIAE